MKKLLTALFLAIIAITTITPIAAIAKDPPTACYRIKMLPVQGLDVELMSIDLSVDLTNEKGVQANSKALVEKNCNKLGKTLYGRLMKIDDIAVVVVQTRALVIRIYPLPGD